MMPELFSPKIVKNGNILFWKKQTQITKLTQFIFNYIPVATFSKIKINAQIFKKIELNWIFFNISNL